MKFKLSLIFLVLFSLNTFSQDKKLPEGWDKILLNGETAYMNLVTGDVSKTFPTKKATKPVKKEVFDPTVIHTVVKGETLSSIARKYGLNLAKLYRLNSMTDFDTIEIGDEVVVGYAKNEEEKEQILTGKKEESEDSYQVNQDYHTVASGETLFSIARGNNLSVSKLKELNKLAGNVIFVGQKLKIK